MVIEASSYSAPYIFSDVGAQLLSNGAIEVRSVYRLQAGMRSQVWFSLTRLIGQFA